MSKIRVAKPELKEKWANVMLLHIVGAGFDTLGSTLASCFSFVVDTPGCQRKLFEEITKAKLEATCRHEDLMQLSYLQACIRETLRLKPVVATSLSRTVPMHGCRLGDVQIAGGATVGFNPVVLHRDKEIFGDDADCFRPERWIEASKGQREAMEIYNLAFGSPARACPGKNLAWLILMKTMVEILRNLEIRVLEDKEVMQQGLPAYKEASFFVYKPYNIWAEFKVRS